MKTEEGKHQIYRGSWDRREGIRKWVKNKEKKKKKGGQLSKRQGNRLLSLPLPPTHPVIKCRARIDQHAHGPLDLWKMNLVANLDGELER